MTATTTGNKELIERARRVTAADHHDIGSRSGSVFTSAEGAWLTDVEGNRVLDLTASDGTLFLGHRHPRATAAFVEQLTGRGSVFASTLSLPRIELAERLCARYPGADKAVFTKTGSEATTMAVRLARAATGRDLVLSSGYHGWHDWQLPYTGLGLQPGTGIVGFGYSLVALERLLAAHAAEVAAVFVTPELLYYTLDDYRAMSALCARYGVLFMLDEVFTGIRFGNRGVHGTGEVPADVVAAGKGLSNGHPMAVVMGRRDVLDAYDVARVEGTYARETPSMAAMLAVLDVIEDGSVHAEAERLGTRLRDGMRDTLRGAGIPALVGGPPLMFDVILEDDELATAIYRASFERGVYFDESGTQLVLAAFDDAAVDHALTAFDKAVAEVAGSSSGSAAGEPDREFLLDFAESEFGGYLRDDERTRALIDRAVVEVGERDRGVAPWRAGMAGS